MSEMALKKVAMKVVPRRLSKHGRWITVLDIISKDGKRLPHLFVLRFSLESFLSVVS